MTLLRESIEFVSKHEYFTRFTTAALDGNEHIETPFDHVINSTLDKTFTGEITRLIIRYPLAMEKQLKPFGLMLREALQSILHPVLSMRPTLTS